MKKIGLLALVLVFALGALGVGYAHWSQTLYIDGTVNTGEVKVALRDAGTNSGPQTLYPLFPEWSCPPDVDAGFDQELDAEVCYDKDVAEITSTNVTSKCEKEDPFGAGLVKWYETEKITITNAYPSFSPGWFTMITNCGTIPVKVSSFKIVDAAGDPLDFPCWIELLKWVKYHWDADNGVWVEVANGASHPITVPKTYNYYGDRCQEMLVTTLMGQQLHPCDIYAVYIELHTTQEFCTDPAMPDMPMGATFEFFVEIEYTQWNLVP
jgi:hypothetical protein